MTKKEIEEQEREFRDLLASPVYVTVGKKTLTVHPVPMGEIPRIGAMITALDEVDISNVAGMGEEQLQLMADFIYEAIKVEHPTITPPVILKFMTIKCFPDFMMAVMDLNDFFAKMGDMNKMAAGLPMTLGFPNISTEPPVRGGE